MTDGLWPVCDRDVVSVLKRRLSTKFAEILLSTKVTGLKEQKNGVAVSLENLKGVVSKQRFDKVLISIGRRPNNENLGFENTAVKVNDKGFVEVDGMGFFLLNRLPTFSAKQKAFRIFKLAFRTFQFFHQGKNKM